MDKTALVENAKITTSKCNIKCIIKCSNLQKIFILFRIFNILRVLPQLLYIQNPNLQYTMYIHYHAGFY